MSSSSGESSRNKFDEEIREIKEIEKRDSVYTSKQQIDRLLKPGSTYLNLNPFEVLQVDHETKIENIKKAYKRLSILVHPDKNPEDDRAQKAFEIVNKAWKILENDVTRNKCLDVYSEAKQRTDLMIVEKRKKLKKDGKSDDIPEDNPEKYDHAVYVTVMKLFADMERKRQQQDVRDMEERKRKREQEIEEEEMKEMQKEYAKNFEESREARVSSWQKFQSSNSAKKKKKKVASSSFAPPKVKAETRN
jgi:DnaJ family protein C protein 8